MASSVFKTPQNLPLLQNARCLLTQLQDKLPSFSDFPREPQQLHLPALPCWLHLWHIRYLRLHWKPLPGLKTSVTLVPKLTFILDPIPDPKTCERFLCILTGRYAGRVAQCDRGCFFNIFKSFKPCFISCGNNQNDLIFQKDPQSYPQQSAPFHLKHPSALWLRT